jgi:D-alanyl-D-alanine carboxypeptidase
MSKPFRVGSAASFVVLATMLAGCATSQKQTGFGGRANGEVGLATRALMALNANDIPTAINFAERAVEKTPDDAGFRALLGNAYFAAGRFWSAESAYKDSLAIYSNQPQVVLKLSLVEIALGKNEEAVAVLDAGQSVIDPADYGLALALAGRNADALPVLESAARAQGADARVRQNLALAYAFAGNWTQARTVASQDVPANQLDARIQQWMQLAKPARPADQVAALVGVTPAGQDQGQPTRLALRKGETRVAEAASAQAVGTLTVPLPAPTPVALPTPEIQAPQPQFVEAAPPAPTALAQPPLVAEAPVVAETAFETPSPVAALAAAEPEARVEFAAPKPRKAPAARPAAVRKAPAPAERAPVRNAALRRGNSTVVVQLGAFGSPDRVLTAWNSSARKYGALRSYMPMSARFSSQRGVFYRLSVRGFGSLGEAKALCASVRRSGGSCFVRNFAGDTPVQYASR